MTWMAWYRVAGEPVADPALEHLDFAVVDLDQVAERLDPEA